MKTRRDKCLAWQSNCDKCKGKCHYSTACSQCSQCGSWGHKSSKSRRCTQKMRAPEQEVSAMNASLCTTFIGQQLEGVFSLNDFSLATVGNKNGRVTPLNHHIFNKDRGWVARSYTPHPILVTTTPCPADHCKLGHPVTNAAALKPVHSLPMCADTGCQFTAVPPSYVYKAGYKRKDFIPVSSRMNGAGRSDLGVLGAVIMEFSCTGADNTTHVTRQLCYVCDKVLRVYVSRQACCITPQLPTPHPTTQSVHSSACIGNGQDKLCSWPTRPSNPPPLPTELPPGVNIADAGSVDMLKTWLLQYYGSTTFNTCEHQPLPLMTGTPLQLHVDPEATPVACCPSTPALGRTGEG